MKKSTLYALFCLLITFQADNSFAERQFLHEHKRIPRIYGGASVKGRASTFPLLIGTDMQGRNSLCSGTFIAKNIVLTARHCTEDEEKNPLSSIQVFDGKVFERAVALQSSREDIALLLVSESSSRKPLALLQAKGRLIAGNEVVVGGYGLDENDKTALDRSLTKNGKNIDATKLKDSFKQASVIVAGEAASQFGGYKDAKYVFVQNEGDGKPCQGDSGGPLTIKVKGKEYLLGVLSFGDVEPGGKQCSSDGLSAYTELTDKTFYEFTAIVKVPKIGK